MNKKRIIGTYYLLQIAQTNLHIKDMKECNIDFVIGIENNKRILDLLQQYDIKAIINKVVPYSFGSNGQNKGSLET